MVECNFEFCIGFMGNQCKGGYRFCRQAYFEVGPNQTQILVA